MYGCCLKLDNARPFVNLGSSPECRHGRGNKGWKRSLSLRIVYAGGVEVLILKSSSLLGADEDGGRMMDDGRETCRA